MKVFNIVNDTVKKVNIFENHLKTLSLFTDGFKKEFHIRETAKLLSLSSRTAKTTLEFLENKGVIESKKIGNIKSYRLKNNDTSRRYLVFTEQYKAISFLENDLLIKEAVEKISPSINGIGVVFGSYAKGISDEESDLDIFIAGEYDIEAVKKVSKNLGIEISVKCYPLNTFEKKLKTGILIKEVLKNHIVFKNAELFIEKVMADE